MPTCVAATRFPDRPTNAARTAPSALSTSRRRPSSLALRWLRRRSGADRRTQLCGQVTSFDHAAADSTRDQPPPRRWPPLVPQGTRLPPPRTCRVPSSDVAASSAVALRLGHLGSSGLHYRASSRARADRRSRLRGRGGSGNPPEGAGRRSLRAPARSTAQQPSPAGPRGCNDLEPGATALVRPLEQRALGGHPVAPWIPLRALLIQDERPEVERSCPRRLRHETEHGEGRRGPPLLGSGDRTGLTSRAIASRSAPHRPARGCPARRHRRPRHLPPRRRGVADHEPPPVPQERCAALRSDGRTSEPSGDHEVERPSEPGVSGSHLRPGSHDLDPVRQRQLAHGPLQELATTLGGVEQHHRPAWPRASQHQPGEAAPGAEVQRPRRRRRQTGGEAGRVLHLSAKGAGPEEPQAPAPFEHPLERGIAYCHDRGPPCDRPVTPGGSRPGERCPRPRTPC